MSVITSNLWVGYMGMNLNNLYVIPYDGSNWGDQIQVGGGAQTYKASPALTIWNDTLWVAFVGKNESNLYVISYDGSNWGDQIQVGGGAQTSGTAPALTVWNNQLWVGYVGKGGNDLYVISYNGSSWGKQVHVGAGAQTNSRAPALAVFNDDLWMGYMGAGGNNLYVVAYNGSSWGSQSQAGSGAQAGNVAPALTTWAPPGGSSTLCLGYVGENGGNLYEMNYNGTFWGSQNLVGSGAQTLSFAPALTAWSSQPGQNGSLNNLWMGYTGPHYIHSGHPEGPNDLFIISFDGSNWGSPIPVGSGAKTNEQGPRVSRPFETPVPGCSRPYLRVSANLSYSQ